MIQLVDVYISVYLSQSQIIQILEPLSPPLVLHGIRERLYLEMGRLMLFCTLG